MKYFKNQLGITKSRNEWEEEGIDFYAFTYFIYGNQSIYNTYNKNKKISVVQYKKLCKILPNNLFSKIFKGFKLQETNKE